LRAVPSRGPIEPLAVELAEAAGEVVGGTPAPAPLEPPAQPEHGDLATPLALTLARFARRAPREIADALAERLRARLDGTGWLERAEVAGPGFLNLTLSPRWFARAAREMAEAGEAYGAGQAAEKRPVLIEFVSANPTGPLHVGHARQAAYGDAVARIMAFAGRKVAREHYANDYGRQMDLFGASVAARYAELLGLDGRVPQDGYQGEYVAQIAEAVRAEVGDRFRDEVSPPSPEAIAVFTDVGGRLMMDANRAELERFRVRFERFASEAELQRSGRVAASVQALLNAGDAYRHDGAVWFRTTAYGDEKDRVLVRADGTTTYLAADVAYHLDKAARTDGLLLDVLGADHHGYVARLRAVLAAGGQDPERLEVVILQLVNLVERGEARRMSKRAGTLVTLEELMDDIGVDAGRFFLVQRSHETPIDLDLDLARERSQENPVYYVQYAHARVAGILAQLDGEGPLDVGPPPSLDPSERALVLRLTGWPEAVREAEERRAPHRVAAYLHELAREFHAFYTRCRVVGETPSVTAFRLDVCRATAGVIRLGLGLIGVEAPYRM
jgi:arginyl-tRNA synthetase